MDSRRTAYGWIVSLILMGVIGYAISRTRAGYTIIYYLTLLTLLTLIATQAPFIVAAFSNSGTIPEE